jgi:PAS domain S-box-containing protein
MESYSHHSIKRISILLVDDQVMMYEAIRRLLSEQEDIALYFCSDPQQASNQAVQLKPTIIFQDLVMPDVDGLELVRQYRDHESLMETPIIVLSTKEDPEIKSQAFVAGANDYLIKFPDKIEFVARVRLHAKAYLHQVQRTLAESALRKSEERFQLIALATNDILWDWNLITNELWWNENFYKTFKYSEGEIERTIESWTSRIHPEDTSRIEDEIHKVIKNGEHSWTGEYRFRRGDDSYAFVIDRAYVVLNQQNKPVRMLGSLIDITSRKQMEEELIQMRDEAVVSAKLKSEFLANMSHEIRTPMNGVIGMNGLLLDTDLTEEQRDYAQTVQSSADGLLRIIDDILDFSKIEAGQMHFEKIDFDLSEPVEGTIELLAERAQSKGVELASIIYQDVPTALRSDPGRLRQVLTNLIGNAIKFTEQGEVVVSVKKEKETDRSVMLRFEVTDTGIGISDEAKRQLFQAFVQADGSTTRKYGGTGLGLAISKQLVELMDGEIGIKSEVGKGSTFWFTARFEKQEAPITPIQILPDVNLEGLRVLIVDDNETNRKIFVYQTTSWGMLATGAASGIEALSILKAAAEQGEPFDVAILDLMMPKMDGFELARKIKSDTTISQTHLVMLPSYGKRGHGQLARDLEIAAYLQKPVRQSQLYKCLKAVVAGASGYSGSGERPTNQLITKYSLRSTILPENEPQTALAKARILVAEDNVVNQKVALSQLKSLGYAAEAVFNGREAVNAIGKQQYDVVLMDCQMPEMDGFEATAEIRKIEGDSKHTTIIAMTAHALEGERDKCLAAGMDDYISKPVKMNVLKETLEQWIVSTIAD